MENMDKYKPNFQRPTMDGFPNVFKECVCKSKADPDKSVRIKIQEVPEDMHDKVVEFMVNYFLPDEPLARSINMVGEELSVQTYKLLLALVLKQNLSLVALSEDDQLIGVLLFTVFSNGDPKPPQLPGVALEKMRKLFDEIKTEDIISELGTDQHLQDMGICVHPEYRGWGIGETLLRAGNDLGAHIGVRTILTLFTVINAQVLAEKLGYTTLNQFKYNEYKDEDGNLMFPGDTKNTEAVKLMMLSF